MAKIVMAWSQCKCEIGDTGDKDTFATKLTDVGVVKQNGATLSASEGDSLEAKDSGGKTVAREQMEGTLDLTVTIIEPSSALYEALGIADAENATSGEQNVKTLIVPGDKSVKITPKNSGAYGIKAPVTRVSVAPAFGNDTGNELTLTFHINMTTDVDSGNYLYTRFKTKSALV